MTVILVLGATGFIGGHICLAALERGWQVRGLRRNPAATGMLGAAAVEWFTGSLEDARSLAPALRKVDVVFHAAAYYPSTGRDVARQVAGQSSRRAVCCAPAATPAARAWCTPPACRRSAGRR
ncbi:MAG: NAD-dependent epimerase/dehydratase family protein [Chloroflexi bacterium]|nr:NAD-dependent epimerase/dehydratase family protein [Chloroflexota bacterium]